MFAQQTNEYKVLIFVWILDMNDFLLDLEDMQGFQTPLKIT